MLLKVYKSRVWVLLFMLLPFVGNAQLPPDLPVGWEFTENPNSGVYAIQLSVAYDGVDPLAADDWVGAFYDDEGVMECAGAAKWTGTENIAVVVFGNDTLAGDKNGFSDGEMITWKFYRDASGTEEEVGTIPEFSWVNGALEEIVEFTGVGCEQTVEYVTGWNWISFWCLPEVPTIGNVLADYTPSAGDVLKTQAASAFYNGSIWLPPNFTINYDDSYLLLANGAPGSFDVEGTGDIVVTESIDITGGGWTWIGYKPEASLTPSVALQSLAPFLPNDIVKTQAATAFYNGALWLPPNFTMERGVGYKLLYQGADNTLTYPETDNVVPPLAPVKSSVGADEAPDWTPEPGMETNLSVYVNSATLEGVSVSLNSIVGAFKASNDVCRGVAPMEDFGLGNPQAVLTVGFNSDEEGEDYYYLVWDFDTDIIYEVNETDVFENNAFLTRDLTLIPQIVPTSISGTVVDELTLEPLENVEITATSAKGLAIDEAPDWEPEPGMETNLSVYVNSATLNGTSVSLNSIVGAFKASNDVCRGVAPMEDFGLGNPQAVLTVGFNSDEETEEYYYLVWDFDSDIIYEVNETDVFENNAFLTRDLTLIGPPPGLVTFTDENGYYEFMDVPDGTYTVCTGATILTEGYIDECGEEPVTVPPSVVLDFALTPECVDASIENWPADPDDVCEGAEFDIDFNGVQILNAVDTTWTVDPAEAGEYDEVDGFFYLAMDYVGDVTITLTAFAQDPCNDATASLSFTVNPNPFVECPEYEPVCVGSDEIVFPEVTGGIYYDEAGNPVTGLVPDMAALYFFELIVENEFGCVSSCGFEIEVLELPDVECPEDMMVCVDIEPFELIGGLPEGGTYSGPGVVDGVFDTFEAGLGDAVITYTYTNLEGCTNSCDFIITVNDLPAPVCPEGFEICIDADPVVLEGAIPEDGTYGGTGVVDGIFYPDVAGVGYHELFYSYTDPVTLCTGFCVIGVEVYPLPEVTCPEDMTYLLSELPVTLEGAQPIGGVYSGVGVEDGIFLVEVEGLYDITYTYLDVETGCTNFCTFTITVGDEVPCPIINNFPEFQEDVCQGTELTIQFAGVEILNAIDTVWMVEPMEAGEYDGTDFVLNTDYVGMVTLTLTAVAEEPCEDATASLSFMVNPEPAVGFCFNGELAETGSEFVFCYDENVMITLCEVWSGTAPFDIEYSLNGEPAVLIEDVMLGGLLFEGTLPVGDHMVEIVSITDANGCSAQDVTPYMASITVNPEPAVGFCFNGELAETGSEFVFCYDENVMITLCEVWSGTAPFDIEYSLNGEPAVLLEGLNLDDVLFEGVLPVGEHTVEIVSIVDANGCAAGDVSPYMASITVNPEPDANFCVNGELAGYGDMFEVCEDELVDVSLCETLSGNGPFEVCYQLNEEPEVCVTVDEGELIFSGTLPVGTHTVQLTSLTDANGCMLSDPSLYMMTITVTPLPEITMQPMSLDVLWGQEAVFMVEADNATGYQWYGPDGEIDGANEATFTIEAVSDDDAGEYYVMVFGECGDVMSDIVTLTVNPWTQQIDFNGLVNGMSTYLSLTEDQLEVLFADLLEQVVYVEFKNPDQAWSPLNASFAFDEEQGAKVILNGGFPTSIVVTGYPTLGTMVDLSAGNNFLPVYSQGVVLADDVFSQLGDDLFAVFSLDYSGFWWPAYDLYTLEFLVPGSSYLVIMNAAGTVDFDVPAVDANPGYADVPRNVTNWQNATLTGTQHNIAITADALSQIQVGDVIGAFNEYGQISGMVEVTSSRDNIVLRTFGDNTQTKRAEGFVEGDMITIKVWRDGEEMIADATFDENMPNQNIFAKDGVSAITNLKLGATSVNDLTAGLQASLYPNPATDLVNIQTNFEIENIKVVNYVGQVVLDQDVNQENYQINTSDYSSGMYFVQIENNEGVVITKRLTVK